jgi:hypothetical protein
MKKTYINPAIKITEIVTSKMVCDSIRKYGDTAVTYGNLSKDREDNNESWDNGLW